MDPNEQVDVAGLPVKRIRNIKEICSDISGSMVAQVSTLIINFFYFFISSAWLSKSDFGLSSFCIAAAQVTASLLTLGNSPVIVRRLAANAAPLQYIAGSALFQRLAFPILFAAVCLPILSQIKYQSGYMPFMIFAFFALALGEYSDAIRQLLIGMQRFWWVTSAAVTASVIRAVTGLLLIAAGYGVWGILFGLLAGSLADGLVSLMAVRKCSGYLAVPSPNWAELRRLLKEGLPLFGAAVFDRALARGDWIIMGVLRSRSETGEYAFAYRLFELCWLPHAILSTVLLPKLSAAIGCGQVTETQKHQFTSLFRIMVAISIFPPLAMVAVWSPVVDSVTGGKYGSVNQNVIMVLSIATPFAAATCLMWNLALASRKTTGIMVILCTTSAVNLCMNAVLIPLHGSMGAAAAMVSSGCIQSMGYVWMMRKNLFVRSALNGLAVSLSSWCIGLLTALFLPAGIFLRALVGLCLCLALVILFRAATLNDLRVFLTQSGDETRAEVFESEMVRS